MMSSKRERKVLEIMQHLIWGVFDSDNNLEFAFRIDEDGVALGCEEERLELQEDHRIGVIHPMQFSVQERELWQNVLMDHQIIQPFAQIQRACCSATALELTDVKITRFSANETTGGLISQTFSDANWESTDGVGRFTKLFHSAGLIAAVRHDEFLALDWRDRQYHIQEVFFVDVRTPKKAWSKPSCRIKIGEVEPLILSEVLWLAHKACGLM